MTTEAQFPRQSNAGDWAWTGTVEIPPGTPYDLTGVTAINVAVRNSRHVNVLTGSLGNEVVVTDAEGGLFDVTIRASRMKQLCEGQYEVGVVIVKGEDTTQVLLGDLPIREGLPK